MAKRGLASARGMQSSIRGHIDLVARISGRGFKLGLLGDTGYQVGERTRDNNFVTTGEVGKNLNMRLYPAVGEQRCYRGK